MQCELSFLLLQFVRRVSVDINTRSNLFDKGGRSVEARATYAAFSVNFITKNNMRRIYCYVDSLSEKFTI